MEVIIRTLAGIVVVFTLLIAPVHAQVVNSEVEISAEAGDIRIYAGDNVHEFFFFSRPTAISIDITNDGNVAIEPTGTAVINNVLDEQVATVALNAESQAVQVDERLTIKNDIEENLSLGRYRVEVNVQYSQGQEAAATSVFWVLPWHLILAGGVGLVLLIISVYKLRKTYHRRLLSKHGLHQEDSE